MDRSALWPDFRQAWILYEDVSVVAVHKPAGVPSQAVDPEQPDDVVTRLGRFLSRRDGLAAEGAYLGVHQRLDRETSGVLVYARRREANAGLARQFERHAVHKEYVVGVVGWDARRTEATLRDWLEPDGQGGTRVVGSDASSARQAFRSPRDRGRPAERRGGSRKGRGGPGSEREGRRGGGRPDPARDGGAKGTRRRGGPAERGREAVTHVRMIAQRGERALLAVRIETGRTHQIRAQLAHAGASVAGDRRYGGAPAARLMLHASALTLEHPETGAPLRIEDPVPPEMERWLAGEDAIALDDSVALRAGLARAMEARFGLAHADEAKEPTTAFRLVHEAGDGMPGLAVDVYGEHLVAHLYGDEAEAVEDVLLDALDALGFAGVYVKRRPKQANVIVDARRSDLAPPAPLRGTRGPDEIVVREHGLPFAVRLGDGLSTGLFLDQRENRRRVRALSEGTRVLNLFAYTCGFTVAAAAGRAVRTVSVDASRAALDRGAHNLELAHLAGDAHRLVAADVFEALEGFARAGERFDIVIADPPTYSTTHASRWTSGGSWRHLGALALGVLAPAGRLLACSNDRRMGARAFRRHLHDAARDAGREVLQMKDLPVPPDFPPAPGTEPHLASLLVAVR